MSENSFPKFELKSDLRMSAKKVTELYQLFEDNGVEIWIDGGWCVDALLESQTREHADLDIAIDQKHESAMKEILTERGYKVVQTNDKTDWNYVLGDGESLIDVHVFGFDELGNNIYGTKYPKESLSGIGKINDLQVRCINPEWTIQFKSHPKQNEVDQYDQDLLCRKFGLPKPPIYRP